MIPKKEHWYNWLLLMIKEFFDDAKSVYKYKIVDLYDCKNSGCTKAVIKLSERHVIKKNISDIIIDDKFIENLDAKTIRALTYIATVENLKPDCAIVVQHMTDKVDDYILEIKDKNKQETIRKSAYELSVDKSMISRFNSIDANRIGYLAGLRETARVYKMIKEKIQG